MAPEAVASELRGAGLPVGDEQLLTPLRSVQTYLQRFRRDARVLPFLTDAARRYLEGAGVHLVDGQDGRVDAVFVAQPSGIDFDGLELASRAVVGGARLLTGSYVPAYAGADGPIFSRGAMTTAAIAKASGVRPIVVGKPSHAAVREMRDAARRSLGGDSPSSATTCSSTSRSVIWRHSTTVLVRSGISGALDLSRVPEKRRPHLTVDSVAELLEWL